MPKIKSLAVYSLYPVMAAVLLATPLAAMAQLPTTCAGFVSFFARLGRGLSAILFALAIIILLVSAFYFLTGGGNEEAQKKARGLLIYALIGLAVALFAFVLPNIIESVLGGTRGSC